MDQWVPSPASVKLRTAGVSDGLGRGLSGGVARKNDLLLLHGFRSQATHDHDASVVGAGAGRWFSAECSGVSNTVDMDWRGDFPKREMSHQRPYLALGRTEWCRMASVG